jgi:EAL domain-containing protein (putative c-di-GMP-specific phosphodiesterase class I)
LLRWDRPGRLPAPPSVFIPLAEELGLISEIGAFVLMEACRKVSNFDDRLSISVNASPIQFQNRSIIKAVQNALAATGLSANRLIVEVTETLLMLNDSATRECMDTLSKMGVRLALDDFGIGFSALSYLAQFQFNEVKIDKAFVAQIEDGSVNAAIIHAILNIGKSLNMAVVAEGVETCAQAERLRSMGCVNFQGYLYGKPSKDLLNMPPMHQSLCA